MTEKSLLIVERTDDNHDALVRACMCAYLGERCKFCGKVYDTIEQLNDTVFAGCHKHGRLACKSCWDANKEQAND